MHANILPSRLAEIKKVGETKYWLRFGTLGTLMHRLWESKLARPLCETTGHDLEKLAHCVAQPLAQIYHEACIRMHVADWLGIAKITKHTKVDS